MRHLLTACTLGLGLFVAACGNDSALIPERDAQAIVAELEQLRAAADARQCDLALDALRRARTRADQLSRRVDRELRREIESALRDLGPAAQDACAPEEEKPQETAPETTQEPTETLPPTVPPTTPETTPVEPTIPPTTAPDEGGTPPEIPPAPPHEGQP